MKAGDLIEIDDDFTCTQDPTDKEWRFALSNLVCINIKQLALVVNVVDCSDPADPLHAQDDVWFLGITSCGHIGWIPRGDTTERLFYDN